MAEKKKAEPTINVVEQLPTLPQRELTDEEGKVHVFETLFESIAILRKDVEEIKKSVA